MTTRARNTADIVEDVDASLATKLDIVNQQSNRNLLYNGAMQVHQRGTSVTGIATGAYYTVDRWNHVVNSLGTWTDTVENDAPTGSGFRKSWKTLCTTADATPGANTATLFEQRLEGQDLQRIYKGTASAQELTVSFWVKSNVTGTYIVELVDVNNLRRVSASYTINVSATWEKKILVFPADTTGVLNNDNTFSFAFVMWLGAGSNFSGGSPLQTAWGTTTNTRAVGQTNLAAATNNYWQITGVQLEVGPVATEFEFKSFGQELRECQRYYYRQFAGGEQQPFGSGQAYGATIGDVISFFPVTMRIVPTAVEQNGTASDYRLWANDGLAVNCSAVPTFSGASSICGSTRFTVSSGLAVGNATSGRAVNANAYLGWSAEL